MCATGRTRHFDTRRLDFRLTSVVHNGSMDTPRLTALEVQSIMVRRGPNPPGPLAIYAALFQAGEVGVAEQALIDRARWGDRRSFAKVLQGISRRVASVTGRRFTDYQALIVERHDGGRRLALRREVLDAIEADSGMRRILMLPVEEILATRNPADPQRDQTKWPRLA